MFDPSRCPFAETLALLPDGIASRSLRRTLVSHLDECTHCRTVLAFVGQYKAARDERDVPDEAARTAFYAGVLFGKLRAQIEEGRGEDAVETFQGLRSLIAPEALSAHWAAVEERLPNCHPRGVLLRELGSMKSELSRRHDPVAFALGLWAEASRLAASRGNRSFFVEPYFRETLGTLERLRDLRAIRDALEPEPRTDVTRLERAFIELIAFWGRSPP